MTTAWLNLAPEQPVRMWDTDRMREKQEREQPDSPQGKHFYFDHVISEENKGQRTSVCRQVCNVLFVWAWCVLMWFDQRSECDLQAKVRLASLLTTVPKELEARHWYVPASSSLLRWLMRRLPPERLWWEPGLGLSRLPFSFHLQHKVVHSSEISIWTHTYLIMTIHDLNVITKLIF